MFGELDGLNINPPSEEDLQQPFKVLLIDTESETLHIVETVGGLDEWYKLIQCELIDIQERTIEGWPFDFITDDNALYGEPKRVSVLDSNQQPQFVGRTVICRSENGKEIGLREMDIKLLMKHGCILKGIPGDDGEEPPTWAAIIGADY